MEFVPPFQFGLLGRSFRLVEGFRVIYIVTSSMTITVPESVSMVVSLFVFGSFTWSSLGIPMVRCVT